MADSKLVGSFGRDCEGGSGERGDRGHRGHRGHRGPRGHQGVPGPGADAVPTPPFAISTTTIYARVTGDDVTGDGTIGNPYRTFQRAIRDVPLLPAPGASFIVDITGIGTELIPAQYCLPQITFPTMVYQNDTSVPFFYSGAGLRVRALPQLASTIPAGDAVIDGTAGATITADPDTNLITLTIASPRPSWSTANLRNKQVIRTVGSYFANSVIVDATPTTLVLTNDAGSFNGGVGPLVLAPGEVLQIVEPSATLQTDPTFVPIDYTGVDAFAGMTSTCNSIAWQGIKFTQPGSGFPTALGILNCPQAPLELCDVEGLASLGQAGTYWTFLNGCVVRANLLSINASTFSAGCHFDTIGIFYLVNATPQSFFDAIFSGCASLGSVEQTGLPILCNLAFQNCLIQNSVPGLSFSPNGDGIYMLEGRVQLQDVKIDGAAGNGLFLDGSGARAGLVHVTGMNTLFGILANNGAQVAVDAATTVTGASGDTKSGSLAPTTYAQVAGGFAYDLPPNAASINVATGTRIFQS